MKAYLIINFPMCVCIHLFVCLFVACGLLQSPLIFVIFGTNVGENVQRVFIACFQRQYFFFLIQHEFKSILVVCGDRWKCPTHCLTDSSYNLIAGACIP